MTVQDGSLADEEGMTISIVIPHLNQPQALRMCLASLAAGRRLPDEVLVVDNGSAELPQAICEAYPEVRLLQEHEPGPGIARNRGIAESSGDILAFIDADCIADPEWLAVIEAEFRDPAAEILGGDVRIAYADAARPTMIEAYESIYAYRMDRYIAEQGFTGTGNLAVRREVLEAVGPFAGLGVAEDRDWGQRATAQGHVIRYLPQMRAYHPGRERFSDLAAKWDRHTAHDFADARRRPGGRLRFAAKTVAMALSPLVELPRVMTTDRISGAGTRVRAFAGLVRIRLYRAWVMARSLASGQAEALLGRWNRP